MARNPPWTRDELILALDLYFQVNPLHSSESHPEINALSRLLNELPLHAERPDEVVFRNPNGVYMKLCNYLRLDPTYHGRGLSRGGKQEEEIWEEFAGDRHRLHEIAHAIRQGYRSIKSKDLSTEMPSPDEEFLEGRILTALHKRRERNPTVVRGRRRQCFIKRVVWHVRLATSISRFAMVNWVPASLSVITAHRFLSSVEPRELPRMNWQ